MGSFGPRKFAGGLCGDTQRLVVLALTQRAPEPGLGKARARRPTTCKARSPAGTLTPVPSTTASFGSPKHGRRRMTPLSGLLFQPSRHGSGTTWQSRNRRSQRNSEIARSPRTEAKGARDDKLSELFSPPFATWALCPNVASRRSTNMLWFQLHTSQQQVTGVLSQKFAH
jgi:hypothetical protein